MSPYSWFWYLKYVVTWNYTSSISLGIVSVNNVFYGVLIVKHFISDGLRKTKYSWRNLIFPWTFWQTIYDVIFMNKLKSFIVKMNRYDIFLYFSGVFFVYVNFYLLLLKQYLLWDQVNLFGNCYIVNFELDVLIISVLFS